MKAGGLKWATVMHKFTTVPSSSRTVRLLHTPAPSHSPSSACCSKHSHSNTTASTAAPLSATAHLHTHSHAAAASSTSPDSSSATTPSSSSSSSPSPVRVRYAPSPTGSVHLGGLRTALYNYLFSRHVGGDSRFLIRIEDTDQKRLVPGAVEGLLRAMSWAGVKHDEGPGCEAEANKSGPYVQSERLHLYKQHIAPLLASGAAYPCFCSPARLEELRESQTKRGLTSMYDRLCLNMDPKEREEKLKECQENDLPYVIRMKVREREKQEESARERMGNYRKNRIVTKFIIEG